MADVKTRCLKTFKHFVEVTSVGQNLSELDKMEIKDKGMHKMLKECCGDEAARASEAQVFPKYCDKKTKKMLFDVFYDDFLPDLAACIIQNRKKLTKRPALTDPEVVALTGEMRDEVAAKHDSKTKEMKVDATTARLTDPSQYTGIHKASASKESIGGASSGYVQGYKNEGTYDKTHNNSMDPELMGCERQTPQRSLRTA
ncbi:unnamed protein product [Lymnaea stagnalis]|uniref:Uncharacterized protein n=1 Tax=Lymnaea stagnalis TaxID=6523 RepID=A0AAV2I8P0_LYMST